MVGVRAPHVPEEPVPILTPDDLKALLATCKGRTFADWRDTVIVRLFVDTGVRLAEMTGRSVEDLDMDYEVAVVVEKGRWPPGSYRSWRHSNHPWLGDRRDHRRRRPQRPGSGLGGAMSAHRRCRDVAGHRRQGAASAASSSRRCATQS